MGLKAFQQAWLELLFNAEAREAWQSGQVGFHGLDAQDRQNLEQIDSETLARLVRDSHAQRRAVLIQMLPESVRRLLGEAHAHAVVEDFLASGHLPPFYPRSRLLSAMLNQVLAYLAEQHLIIPHLRDLILYELTAGHLAFFALPRLCEPRPGPVLAPWARTLQLARHFPAVLESLAQGDGFSDLSESPRQDFLLLRDFRGLKLEGLHPLLAICLQGCDGSRTWEELVTEALAQHSERVLEKAALQAWLEHYLQRGILSLNTGVGSEA